MKRSLSVIIPNYNGRDLLSQNLPSLYHAIETSGIDDYEIIVSDDHSHDDSLPFLEKEYPEIVLLKHDLNVGFSGNCNRGIFKATKDLIFLLNSDVQLTESYFKYLLPYFETEDTFGVAGKIIGLESGSLQDAAKYPQYHFGNIGGTKNYYSKSGLPIYTFFMSGANALVDRKKIVAMGGFREIFNPYYWEDVDLGIRAWRLGYKIYYDDRSVCKHPNGATIGKESSEKVNKIAKRNKMFIHYLHLNGIELNYYLLKLALKIFFHSLSRHSAYTDAYQLFRKSIVQLRKEKEIFVKLSEKNGGDLSMRQVVRFILSASQEEDRVKF